MKSAEPIDVGAPVRAGGALYSIGKPAPELRTATQVQCASCLLSFGLSVLVIPISLR